MSLASQPIHHRLRSCPPRRDFSRIGQVVRSRESPQVLRPPAWLQETYRINTNRHTFQRSYHSTPFLLKGKGAPKRSVQIATQRSEAAGDDPFDFTKLHKSIADAQERLRTILRQISPSGQFNQETVEAVRVKLAGNEVVSLSDLGQVVSKGGRTIAIIVGQSEHVKYVTSAVLSQLQMNPAPTSADPLELHITVPAPTQESRKRAQKQAVDAGDKALSNLRQARADQQQRHRAMDVSKRVKGDDIRKASKEMDKVMEKATAEAKKTIEAAKKALEH